ncbi:MAG: hypothetical protein ACKVS8_00985 [Phycisphaerales bacterium]
MSISKCLIVLGAAACALLVCPRAGLAQDTTFTYQGQLGVNGSVATGAYDLRFRLYNAETMGTQLGSQLAATGITPLNGTFSVDLNFGAALPAAEPAWLEIDVSEAGADDYSTLSPRQKLTGSPFAHRAALVDWSNVANKPSGFLDGSDDGFLNAGTGLLANGTDISLNLAYTDARYYQVGNLLLNGDVIGNVNAALRVQAINGINLTPSTLAPGNNHVLTYDINMGGWVSEPTQHLPPGQGMQQVPNTYAVDYAVLDARYMNQNPLLSGDVTGVASANTVAGLQGRPVLNTAPIPNQVLKWNGVSWAPATDTNNIYTAGTGLTLSSNQFSVNFATVSASYVDESQSAGGDATGTFANLTVDGLQARPVSSAAPAVNDVLRWNGALWAPAAQLAYTAGTALELSGTQFSVSPGSIGNAQLASDAASLLDVSGGNMRVSSGNVGIGSGTPTSQLHVFGNTTIVGSLTMSAVNRHWSGPAHNWAIAATSGGTNLTFTSNGWNGPSSSTTYVMQQPINLPHGVIVNAIEFSAFDNNGNDFTVELVTIPINGSALAAVASVSSVSSAAGVRLFSNVANHTVDNVTNAYGLRASWNTGSQPANMRLHGVHIVYSTTTGLP